MKLSCSKKSESTFPPVSLTIVFESQNELDFLSALFNRDAIIQAGYNFGHMDVLKMRDALQSLGANVSQYYVGLNRALQ